MMSRAEAEGLELAIHYANEHAEQCRREINNAPSRVDHIRISILAANAERLVATLESLRDTEVLAPGGVAKVAEGPVLI